jgi:(E)-4-hydroxy-3-methylbut-2-enyl-diphosphate synthase
MCNLYNKPTLISCPTCGRTNYNMFDIIKEIEPFLNTLNKKIKVAVMGCVVNGPGEARSADIGIAGGKDCAVLFKKGEIVRKLESGEITVDDGDEHEEYFNAREMVLQ